MGKIAAIARTGLMALLLHPLRSGATLACLVAVLLPYLAGVGVARGLADEAEASIALGADLYLAGTRFGRPAPVPLEALARVRAVPGVRDAYPRIVGEVTLGTARVPAVVVGLPADRLPPAARCVEGRLFRAGAGNELVLGAELARRLALGVGARLPPFYRNEAGEKVSTVVGLFRAEAPLWEANLVFCSLETAAEIFDQQGLATAFLVTAEPGYGAAVADALRRLPDLGRDVHGRVSPRVTSRDDLRTLLPTAQRHMAGILQLHFVLAFAVLIPLLMVASGIGLTERRREAALLKATGWMTDELLLRGAVESLALCLLGASAALLLAWVWLAACNGRGIAGIFLPGVEAAPAFRVPFRLLPLPAFLAFLVSFAVVASGTLYSTWRAATAAPAAALR
jgi:ABC-type lipoprotein release transport system permease subunit